MIIKTIMFVLLVISNPVYSYSREDIKIEREIKELERLENDKEKVREDNNKNNNNTSMAIDNNKCINSLNRIIIEGNTIYSTNKLYDKFIKFDNNCITKKDLQNIRDNINNFYIANSYINCRVYFNMIKDMNTIVLVIHEGRIDNINIKEKKRIGKKIQLLTAFPFRKTIGYLI